MVLILLKLSYTVAGIVQQQQGWPLSIYGIFHILRLALGVERGFRCTHIHSTTKIFKWNIKVYGLDRKQHELVMLRRFPGVCMYLYYWPGCRSWWPVACWTWFGGIFAISTRSLCRAWGFEKNGEWSEPLSRKTFSGGLDSHMLCCKERGRALSSVVSM